MQFTSFEVLMQLLRDRNGFLTEIENNKYLDKKIISLLVSSSIFLALYGAIIGSTHGGLQIVSSTFKLPALYLLTLVICLPTLYFTDVVLGSQKTFGQYVTLLLASMAMMSVMLFGFAPVTLFFRLSIDDYWFFLLLNIIVLGFTGVVGIRFFYKSMMSLIAKEQLGKAAVNRHKLITGWLFLYGFVGSQLGWTLRPFVGTPDQPFALFREIESNFYIQVVYIIAKVLGIQ
ncbi:MAG: actin-binding WH2 domain-containing protein [Cyanobacteria bacterium P01_E01_bin.35]